MAIIADCNNRPSVPTDPKSLLDLINRAEAGDEKTLPVLREMLKIPGTVEMLGGNLALQAEHSFVNGAAGNNLAFREALLTKLQAMRAELAGSNPTPVEQLLVERVVACWLQVQDADVRYAQRQKEATWREAEFGMERMDRAHRRFLSAVRTLALVRKLALPVLQVNIARKQVNVGAANVAAPSNGSFQKE
jgi:hypothetical protein